MKNIITLDDFRTAREVQARFEPVYNLLGRQADAPRVLQGEGSEGLRMRYLEDLKQYSPTWGRVNLNALPSPALDVVESQIFADAQREAVKPTARSLPADGSMVARVVRDAVGRPHKHYFSLDSGSCWNQFKLKNRFVKAWRDPKTGREDRCF